MKNFSSFEELAADSMSSSDATPPAFGDIQNIITDATENMGTLDRHAGYNIFIFEGIRNKLEEDMHKLAECECEQFKWEKSSLEGHLLLLQLNYLPRTLRV